MNTWAQIYQTGKRQYGLGERYAPTRGQVDPSGYIKREINNQNKKKAEASQSRSGLAASALQRSNANQNAFNAPVKPLSNSPKAQGQMRALSASAGAPGQPAINIMKNGALDLPFDEAFSLGMIENQHEANQALLDLQLQEQDQQLLFQRMLRDAGIQFTDLKRDTLNNNAGKGTAFSSAYAVDASENARNYNNFINDLNLENVQALTGFDMKRQAVQAMLNDFIRQAVLARSMDLANQAGDLGYGQSDIEPSYEGASEPRPLPDNNNNNNGGGGNKSNKKDNGPDYASKKYFPRIHDLQKRGLDKSEIVARLTNSRNNSGHADDLGRKQLAAIGFSDNFIDRVKDNNRGRNNKKKNNNKKRRRR